MPGIFGLYTNHKLDVTQALNLMAGALRTEERGVTNVWQDDAGCFGFGRSALSIFINQRQPIIGPRGIHLVAHGQICFPEGAFTKRSTPPINNQLSETDYILERYLAGGLDALISINGGISAAVWHGDEQKLELLPDRFGMRPIYYFYKNGVFAFASEVKALLALNWASQAINEAAVMEMLAMDVLGGDRTLFKDIQRVPFGSSLVFEQGGISIHTKWRMMYKEPAIQRSDQDYLDEFIELTQSAVQCRLSDPRAILALSGGLDSRFLLASGLTSKIYPPTVTYGSWRSRDIRRAGMLAHMADISNIPLILKDNYPCKFAARVVERADGLYNALNCHGLSLIKVADRYSILVLANGVDQLLYSTRSEYPYLQFEKDVIAAYFRNRNRYVEQSMWTDLFNPSWLQRVGNAVEDFYFTEVASFAAETLDNQLDSYMMHYYANGSLSGLPMITQSMEFSEPFYDPRLVEFGLNAPLNIRCGRFLEKEGLKILAPELAMIEGVPMAVDNQWGVFQKNLSLYSRRVMGRLGLIQPAQRRPPSSTFSDMHNLLRLPGNKIWMKSILLSPRALERGIFRPEGLRKLIDEHLKGITNHTSALSTILTIELFFLRFVDQDPTFFNE